MNRQERGRELRASFWRDTASPWPSEGVLRRPARSGTGRARRVQRAVGRRRPPADQPGPVRDLVGLRRRRHENRQSEFLQFFLYIFGTVWLVQRGSPESKEIHKIGTESDREQRVGDHATAQSPRWAGAKDWRQGVYARSLGLVMGTLFILSWAAQSITGMAAYDEQQLRQLQDPVGWGGYLASADFWNRSLQNWQSELLAVAAMVILSVYLRQRGYPESKPVGAAHTSTGVEG